MTCPFWLSSLFSFFCHQVVLCIHLVFMWTRELNSHPRTMAQTVSPPHLPLDQGASFPFLVFFKAASKIKLLNQINSYGPSINDVTALWEDVSRILWLSTETLNNGKGLCQKLSKINDVIYWQPKLFHVFFIITY